jgi:ATP/ADP translocase
VTLDAVFKAVTGPYGAIFLLLAAVIYLWRKLEQSQAVNARQQDLFEEALNVIRDDLLPLVKQVAGRS